MLRRLLFAAFLVVAAMSPLCTAVVAVADDTPPASPPPHASAPPFTELRAIATPRASAPPAVTPNPAFVPVRAASPKKELVIFIGGYGSIPDDGAFDALASLFPPSRYDVVRFGGDPSFPYDTYGPVDASARTLIDEIRAAHRTYPNINLVSHSMGGVVVDRAFSDGLSASDGVRTDVAIAGPHSGSVMAAAPTALFPFIGPVKEIVRAGALAAPSGRDPESPAARDLATVRPVAPPKGIVRLDVSLASDGFVNELDARDPGVEQRVYLPGSIGEALEGHGGSLTSHEIGRVVAMTVMDHAIPDDDRSGVAKFLAGWTWNEWTWRYLVALGCASFCAFALACIRASNPACRFLIDSVARRCSDFIHRLGR